MKKYFLSFKQSGYSLLELVIYIALFALLSLVLIRSLFTVMKTYKTASQYRTLQNNGEIVMERITRETRLGNLITTSACPTNSNSVTITSKDDSGNSKTVSFALTSDQLKLTDQDGNTAALSNTRVSVQTANFCSFSTPVGTGLKVFISLTTTSTPSIQANFYSTVLIRGQ